MAVRRPSLELAVELESVVNLVAAVVKYIALAFLFPAFLALGFGEPAWPFFAAAGITFAAGFWVELLTTGKERVGVREGFLVVALVWLVLPAVGAIPYFLAGEGQLAHPLSAFFESVSGFTATGATVLRRCRLPPAEQVDGDVAAVHAVAWRDGDSHARDRRAPAAECRRAPAPAQ